MTRYLIIGNVLPMATPTTLPSDAALLADLRRLAAAHGCELIPSVGGVGFFGESGNRASVETEVRAIGYRCRQLDSLGQLKVWL